MNIYAILMAGGVGTRFWPRSRQKSPKQVLNIMGKQTMIQATYKRMAAIVEPENIYVVTNQIHLAEIQAQLTALGDDHFIIEPEMRNTAPCIGLAALHCRYLPTGL